MNNRHWVVHVARIIPIEKKACTTSGQSLNSFKKRASIRKSLSRQMLKIHKENYII